MSSTYSTNLRLELIGTGEQQGTWGSTTNTNLGTLLEEAIGGYISVTVLDVGDTTLTKNDGSPDESRNMVINLTGTITAARTVICPAIEKLYVVKNATTGGFDITFKVLNQTGVTIPNGQTYFVYVNGVDVNKIVGNVASTNASNTFTANQIISVTDNTNAALRITQLGNGDALLVEDSSNPDSTPFVVKANGYVGIGLTDPSQALEVNGNVLIETSGSGGNSPFLTLTNTSGATPGSFGPGIGFDNSVANTHGFVISQMQDSDSQLVISSSESPYTSFMSVNQEGNVNIGTSDDPASILQITGTTVSTAAVVGYISGNTFTVTSVVVGTIAVGDRIFSHGAVVDYNTYITAFGTGTGGIGTYTINNATTVSSNTFYLYPSRFNTIGFVDTNPDSSFNQPLGGIEWYASEASTAGAGVKAYVAAVPDYYYGETSIRFGTGANTSGVQAVERMRIASSGNVSIGTKNTSTAKLHVVNDRSLNAYGFVQDTYNGSSFENSIVMGFDGIRTFFGNYQDYPLSIMTNTTERMRINATNGNISMGNSDTAYPLHLFRSTGEVKFNIESGTTGQDTYINFTNASYSGAEFLVGLAGGASASYIWDTAARSIIFGTNAQQRMTITSAGNVGIGMTPYEKLSVNGGVSLQYGSSISFLPDGGGSFTCEDAITNYYTDQDVLRIQPAGSSNGMITFNTSSVAAFRAESMRITSAGRVGIGTTSPNCLLHVEGKTQVTTLELGAESDTTISRVSAGVIAVEGNTVAMLGTVNSFTARQEINSSGTGLTINGNNSGAGVTTAQNRLEIVDTDTTVAADQPLGVIRFGTSDSGASSSFPAAIAARAVDANGGAYIEFLTANTGVATVSAKMTIRGNGDVEIPSAYADSVSGRDVWVTSAGKLGYQTSIRASKTNIEALPSVDWIYGLSPVKFQYRKKNEDKTFSNEAESGIEYGLIAEDVEAVNPDLVFYDETENGRELRGVQYSRLTAPLIQVIKEQKAMIDALSSRISALEAKV